MHINNRMDTPKSKSRNRLQEHIQILLLWFTLFIPFYAQAYVTYDLVPVQDAGNNSDPATGLGHVHYNYNIGLYQVTIEQYTEFLNAVADVVDRYGLYNSNMGSIPNVAGIARTGTLGNYHYSVMYNDGDSSQRPITSVSWFNAARFANWLSNGQLSGLQDETTTEDGAYLLMGAVDGLTITKNSINPNTQAPPAFYIPSDDEWYKAAYYNGAGTYYLFATQSNTPPGNQIGSAPNQANYISNATGYCTTQSFYTSLTVNYLTNVGAFSSSASHYGTFDQTGNVWEWNASNNEAQTYATLRGGAYTSTVPPYILASYYLSTLPNEAAINLGFRLAAPE